MKYFICFSVRMTRPRRFVRLVVCDAAFSGNMVHGVTFRKPVVFTNTLVENTVVDLECNPSP